MVQELMVQETCSLNQVVGPRGMVQDSLVKPSLLKVCMYDLYCPVASLCVV